MLYDFAEKNLQIYPKMANKCICVYNWYGFIIDTKGEFMYQNLIMI